MVSAIIHIHNRSVYCINLCDQNVKMNNGIIKISGFSYIKFLTQRYTESPQIQIAINKENEEMLDVYKWGIYILRTCLSVDELGQYSDKESYDKCIKDIKEKYIERIEEYKEKLDKEFEKKRREVDEKLQKKVKDDIEKEKKKILIKKENEEQKAK